MEHIPTIFSNRILVLGCGNILFGDDGFGPAVAEYLQQEYDVPDDVCIEDVGTASAKLLFTLVYSEYLPESIIIVDAVDVKGKRPGEVFEIEIDNLPESKIGAYSIHQFPDTNLLKELRDVRGVEILILACQVKRIPEEVEMGLSTELNKAIPRAAERVMEIIKRK
jgi:coenzyme F420 hydrogenase subunit delta